MGGTRRLLETVRRLAKGYQPGHGVVLMACHQDPRLQSRLSTEIETDHLETDRGPLSGLETTWIHTFHPTSANVWTDTSKTGDAGRAVVRQDEDCLSGITGIADSLAIDLPLRDRIPSGDSTMMAQTAPGTTLHRTETTIAVEDPALHTKTTPAVTLTTSNTMVQGAMTRTDETLVDTTPRCRTMNLRVAFRALRRTGRRGTFLPHLMSVA